MDLGKRILLARQEAGLSQRQLCGDEITRNMLSQIEHGTARPSMATLQYLAGRLGKPVSYFLEEDALASPNRQVIEAVRAAFGAGDYDGVLDALAGYQGPDPVFDTEQALARSLALLKKAEEAIARGQLPYARELLERAAQAGKETPYFTSALERQRLLLLAKAQPGAVKQILAELSGEDEVLLLRAEDALADGLCHRCAAILDAAEDQKSPQWNLLRGQAHLETGDYAAAARCLHLAEEAYPRQAAACLERCYRELGDYKQAYFYACKQR